MPLFTLENLAAVEVAVAVSLWLFKLDTDPVALVLTFNFPDELDLSNLTLMLEGYKRYFLADCHVCL